MSQSTVSEWAINSPEYLLYCGAPEVIGESVHLVQGGLDAEAAQEVFRVQLVEVKAQFSDPVPLWLTKAW